MAHSGFGPVFCSLHSAGAADRRSPVSAATSGLGTGLDTRGWTFPANVPSCELERGMRQPDHRARGEGRI
jgi:hypothetical protein